MITQSLWYRASYGLILGTALAAHVAHAAGDEPRAHAESGRMLVPALAFNLNGSAVLRDAAMEGKFPEAFRLTDLPPPPPEVLALPNFSETPETAPAFHVATLVAVPRDHPPVLRSTQEELKRHSCTGAGCLDEVRVCSAEGSRCTDVVLQCNVVGKDCRITSIHGDPELLRLRLLEGRLDDTALLYVTENAPAGSLVSQLYAGGAALDAGYHLIVQRESREQSRDRFVRCEVMADRVILEEFNQELGRSFASASDLLEHLAIARFNEKHGTSHTRLAEVAFEEELIEHLVAVSTAFHTRMMVRMIRSQCLLDASGFRAAGAPGSRLLTMPLTDPTPPKVGDVFLVGTPWRVGNPPLDWP